MMPPRDGLSAAIAQEEARLAKLDRERDEIRARLDALRQESSHAPMPIATTAHLPLLASRGAPTTPIEKVRLFRSLFRGREDVFPTRFLSKKTGRAGYAPACANKFVRGVCELPRVKCAECPNQAFLPVADQAVLDHLRGRHVMGVYPLLEDETCWFLAADFDQASWRDDIVAFGQTCRSAGVPVAVERSRSGNGAHAWVFFAAPVPASSARKVGCYLITETMSRRHQLGMASYDRLFPNQDTMPRGGFGNLIALPLQYQPRQHGNTVFLDDRLEPCPDQWAFLASAARMDPATVEAMAQEAMRNDQVIGIRHAEPADTEDAAPWTHLPSGQPRPIPIPSPLPKQVRAVLAQRLFVEKTGLPSPLLNQIKRLAAFQNPEFYKKQGMRLSTATTPRIIACAEEFPEHIALPRGCQTELRELLAEHGVTLVVEDRRVQGASATFRFNGDLTPIQERAAQALLRQDIGVFVAPPGIGKTVLGTYLVAQRGRSALILVHRRPLLDQWITQLSMFLGIEQRAHVRETPSHVPGYRLRAWRVASWACRTG